MADVREEMGNPIARNRNWDPFLETMVDKDEEKKHQSCHILTTLSCTFIGLLVITFAFFSKISLLLMITMTGPNSLFFINKPLGILIIAAMLVTPNLLTFVKSLWKMAFRPSELTVVSVAIKVCIVEAFVALGTAVLTMVAMPHFNILSNTLILNSVCFMPSVFQVASQIKRPMWKMAIPILSILFTALGFILFGVGYEVALTQAGMGTSKMNTFIGFAVISITLVSLNWWENFTELIHFLHWLPRKGDHSNVICMWSSVTRILVTAAVASSCVPIMGEDWPKVKSVSGDEVTLAVSLFTIQALASALCHWFGVVACKMHFVRRSFAVPMLGTTLIVAMAVITVFCIQYKEAEKRLGSDGNVSFPHFCRNTNLWLDKDPSKVQQLLLEVSHSICNTTVASEQYVSELVLFAVSGLSWWVGLGLSTCYIWNMKLPRIERTRNLFVRRLYEAAFIDQSMLLNIQAQPMEHDDTGNNSNSGTQEHIKIYLCATMWHETFDEMVKMITSIFRLDENSPRNENADPEKFDFEAHIYFDDAFQKETDRLKINKYVVCLISTMENVYRAFQQKDNTTFVSDSNLRTEIKPRVMVTPYGGQLEYTLPNNNLLYVHLKNKDCIRHKKRWSQVMYLYYLLGWKLYGKHDSSEKREEKDRKIETEAKNTYILALDGDTDFQPSSLMLLVDRLKMYEYVGAACGRIHPTGTGPMVWYQKFEYAIGHWLQKSSEHVLGCVLCSPGCFSLFRARALMDKNVLKVYTRKANEASHFVQYDQGEDRWLCTLLLQQGWRVEYNAASDAFTNAPQEFKEFYNQRRRWGPSTMANTLDMLHSGAKTAKKNPSISYPFIMYQIVTMISSILSPATVCLMIAGSFSFVFKWNANVSIVLAIVPPALYLLLCFVTKPDTQINIAAFMSIGYAFLMTATFLSIIGDMVQQNTFMIPSGIFLISISLLYIITALLHPQEFPLLVYGLLYIICVPSGYLLLTIYSMANMHVVSWGTRETSASGEENKDVKNKFTEHVLCQMILRCFRWDIREQVYENEKQLMPVGKETGLSQTETPNPQQSQEQNPVTTQEDDSEPSECRQSQVSAHALKCTWIRADFCRGENFVRTQSRLKSANAAIHALLSWIEQLKRKSTLVFEESECPTEEQQFWEALITKYLEPIKEDKATQERIQSDLKSLRNKATLMYFMINLLWIGATFFLQLIGSSINLRLPKVYANGTTSTTEYLSVEPLEFMFLLSFATLLLIQFLAMIYHRVYTLIHFIAYQEKGQRTDQMRQIEASIEDSGSSERNTRTFENHFAE